MLDEVEKLNWKSWGVARVCLMISWNSGFCRCSSTIRWPQWKREALLSDETTTNEGREVSLGSKRGDKRKTIESSFADVSIWDALNAVHGGVPGDGARWREKKKFFFTWQDFIFNERKVVVVQTDWFYPRPSPATSLPIFGNSFCFIDAQMWQRVRWIWSVTAFSGPVFHLATWKRSL